MNILSKDQKINSFKKVFLFKLLFKVGKEFSSHVVRNIYTKSHWGYNLYPPHPIQLSSENNPGATR